MFQVILITLSTIFSYMRILQSAIQLKSERKFYETLISWMKKLNLSTNNKLIQKTLAVEIEH